jgi:hypothetical protein
MERLADIVAEGLDPAAGRAFLWFRPLEPGRAWQWVEAQRTDSERWRALVSLPMEGAAQRQFEVAAATCAPYLTGHPAPPAPRAWPLVARAPRLALRTAAATATVLTVGGSVDSAPSHARVCLLGRNDGGSWRSFGTVPLENSHFTAELPARITYETPARFAVVALAVDAGCPALPSEPGQPVARATSNEVVLAVPPSMSVIESVRPHHRAGDMTPVDVGGRAQHLLHGERLWVQAFPGGGGNPVVAEAELTENLTRWCARLDLPRGRWRLYPVFFSAPPFTVPAPAVPSYDVVVR